VPIQYWAVGSWTTLLSTELNSLASSATAGAISSVGGTSGTFDNTYGGGGIGGYPYGEVEASIGAPAGTLNAGAYVNLWFLKYDGTNYEDGGASVIPARAADVVIPLRAVSTAQVVILPEVPIPPGVWKVLASQVTGQAWAASGNTIKIRPSTFQGQ
jgi:hypothetical protein